MCIYPQTLRQCRCFGPGLTRTGGDADRKSTRLNSSHGYISYAVFCLKKKKKTIGGSCPETATPCRVDEHSPTPISGCEAKQPRESIIGHPALPALVSVLPQSDTARERACDLRSGTLPTVQTTLSTVRAITLLIRHTFAVSACQALRHDTVPLFYQTVSSNSPLSFFFF